MHESARHPATCYVKGEHVTRTLRIVGVIGLAGLLAACGSDPAPTASTPGTAPGSSTAPESANVAEAVELTATATTAPTAILQDVPLSEAGPRDGSVIFLDNGNASTAEIWGGVKEAAESGRWSFSTIPYKSNDPSTLQAAFMTALQKKPTGVILAGESPSTWSASVIDAYAAAGVPIIAGSTCPVEDDGTVHPGSGTCEQNPRTGKALADWVVADAGGQPIQVLMQSMPQYNVYIGFRDAFQQELTRLCPECSATVQETTLAQFGAGQIPSAFVNTLRSNPDYDYVVFDNGAWAQGFIPAMNAAGLADRVKVIGNGINGDVLSQLQAGTIAAWSANAYRLYGYGSFDSLLRVLTGSPGMEENSAVPFQLVTPESAQGLTLPYEAPADALEQYRTLWKW